LQFQLVDDMHSIWDADSFLDRAQELVKKAINERAENNTARADRSRPLKKRAATKRRLVEQVNTHTMGTSFVGKVNAREIAEAQIGEGVGRHDGF